MFITLPNASVSKSQVLALDSPFSALVVRKVGPKLNVYHSNNSSPPWFDYWLSPPFHGFAFLLPCYITVIFQHSKMPQILAEMFLSGRFPPSAES